MRVLFFIFFWTVVLKPAFAAEVDISAVSSVVDADEDSLVLRGVDLKFLTPIFPREHIDCFVLMYKKAAPLHRMVAYGGRSASEKDCFRAVYASMKMRWPRDRAMEIVPGDCVTSEDNIRVLKFIHEFVYKINGLNEDLAGKVMVHIQRKSELPSCATLESFFEELKADITEQ